jgi:hypothetical protein
VSFRNSSSYRSSRRGEVARALTALAIVGLTAVSAGGGVFYAASHIHGVLSLMVFGLVPIGATAGAAAAATLLRSWL